MSRSLEILLVEDNLLNQKVVMFNLKKMNYNITPVVNGVDALKAFNNQRFDLILMDLMLPGMNGFEITSEIRKMEKENRVVDQVPIVALTANTYDNDRNKCIEAGMNEYLAKPFTAQQLIDVIAKFYPQD